MKSAPTLPWVAINQAMLPEYREEIARLAFEHISLAEPALAGHARTILSEHVRVPGFREKWLDHAPAERVVAQLVHQMLRNNNVMSVLVALWADANAGIVDELMTTGIAMGLSFRTDWNWEDGILGFIPNQHIPELEELIAVAESLEENRPEFEKYHLRLAEHWLSSALLLATEQNLESEVASVSEVETGGKVELAVADLSELAGAIEEEDMVMSVEPASCRGDAKEPEFELPAPNANPMSLVDLCEILENTYERASTCYQDSLTATANLAQVVINSDTQAAETHWQLAGEAIRSWKENRAKLQALLVCAQAELEKSISQWPELAASNGPVLSMAVSPNEEIDSAFQYAVQMIHAVLEYERLRSEQIEEMDRLHADITELNGKIRTWRNEAIETPISNQPNGDSWTQMSVADIEQYVKAAQITRASLESELTSLDGANQLELNKLIDEACSLDLFSGDNVVGEIPSEDLLRKNYSRFSIESRIQAAVELSRLIAVRRLSVSPLITTYASQLLEKPSKEIFTDLLGELARHHLDTEVLLLVLGANQYGVFPLPLDLNADIIRSMFGGLEVLAPANGHRLLAQLSVDLFRGWNPNGKFARLETYVAILVAHYLRPEGIPSELLWTLDPEWPIENMPHWESLWQSTRNQLPVKIVTNFEHEHLTQFENARQSALSSLARERTGEFSRSRSIKDRKYKRVLNAHLLPPIESILNSILEIETCAPNVSKTEFHRSLSRLNDQIRTLESLSNADSLQEAFDAGLSREGISNFHAFHGRTVVAALREAVTSVLDFAKQLAIVLQQKDESHVTFSTTELEKELPTVMQRDSVGLRWLETFTVSSAFSSSNQGSQPTDFESLLIHRLLTNVEYIQRLPDFIVSLASRQLAWPQVYECVLGDLAHPVSNVDEVAESLLRKGAPSQVLLLSGISLEHQKQAIEDTERARRKVETEVTELQKLGCSTTEYEDSIRLGRWSYLASLLPTLIQEQQQQAQLERSGNEIRSQQLKQRTREIEDKAIEVRDLIPSEAYALLIRSLGVARDKIDTQTVQIVENYVQDLDYRISRGEWGIQDLETALANFLIELTPTESTDISSMSIAQILEMANDQNYDQLEKIGRDLDRSKLETRVELLSIWETIRSEVKDLDGAELDVADIESINRFYSLFARLVIMRMTVSERNTQHRYTSPIVYAVYDLQHPRSASLDKKCTFVMLPARAASQQNLRFFEETVSNFGWLEDGFVLVFLPGVAGKVLQYLERKHDRKGMLLIDDKRLLSIAFADADGFSPLARLRSLMLNSRGVEHLNIFKVNELVHSRTSIFVGREALIERMRSSNGNFAIYGGRRIGKSSVLQELKRVLDKSGVKVIYHSFDGDHNCTDNASARRLARLLGLDVNSIDDFKSTIQDHLEQNPNLRIAVLLDEMDAYIFQNKRRQVLIQSLRAMSEQYDSRFRVVVAGFMSLYEHLKGRGPYTPASDPWIRMFNYPEQTQAPLGHLSRPSAQKIVDEGFREMLGWRYEMESIPSKIFQRTGGHPALVQYFCMRLQQIVAGRNDRTIRLADIELVFADQHPETSYMAHVKETLGMNIEDPFGRYLMLYLAINSTASEFTYDQAVECQRDVFAPLVTGDRLDRNLERLIVTSVIKKKTSTLFEFTVPEYPTLLGRLSDSTHLSALESEIRAGSGGESRL